MKTQFLLIIIYILGMECIQGSCTDQLTQSNDQPGEPYHIDYNNLGGTNSFQGVTEITLAYWIKLSSDMSGDYFHFPWFFQRGNGYNTRYQTLSISFNNYSKIIRFQHSDSDANNLIFDTQNQQFLITDMWYYQTVSFSEDLEKLYIAQYFPDNSDLSKEIEQNVQQQRVGNYQQFDFSDLQFYTGTRFATDGNYVDGEGIQINDGILHDENGVPVTYFVPDPLQDGEDGEITGQYFYEYIPIQQKSLCGYLQNMDLILGKYISVFLDEKIEVLNQILYNGDSIFLLQNQNNSDKMTIGSKNNINNGAFYLREIQVFSGSTIILGQDISSSINFCKIGIILQNDIVCLQCEDNYFLQQNICKQTCDSINDIQINTPFYCLDQNICNYKCQTCEPQNPNICLTCRGMGRTIERNCYCNIGLIDIPGQYDCQEYVKSYNITTGVFSMNKYNTELQNNYIAMDGEKNDGEYEYEYYYQLQFEQFLYLKPEFIQFSLIGWEQKDNYPLKYKINYQENTLNINGCKVKLTLLDKTRINSITFQYISSDDYFNFKAGETIWKSSELVELASNNNQPTSININVNNLNWTIGKQYEVLSFIKSFQSISNQNSLSVSCSVGSQIEPLSSHIQFDIQHSKFDDTQVSELICGYIVIPQQYLSDKINKIFNDNDYVYGQKPVHFNSQAKTSFKYQTINQQVLYSQYFFIGIQRISFDSTETINYFPIPQGLLVKPRVSQTDLEVQISTDLNQVQKIEFMFFNPIQKCMVSCDTCIFYSDQTTKQIQCSKCSETIDPTNRLMVPPLCGCIKNFYENYVDGLCYECTNQKCDQCYKNADTCVQCKKNRIRIPGIRDTVGPPSCDCLPGERQYLHLNIPYCGTCSFSFPLLAELSKDYKIIKIIFDYELDIMLYYNTLNAKQKMRNPITTTCYFLFEEEFIQKLGSEPYCYLGNDNDGNIDFALIIEIGGQPLVFPDDTIQIKPNSIRDAACSEGQSLSEVLPIDITYSIIPEPLPLPIIDIQVPETPVTVCPEITLFMKSVENDLNYGVKLFSWSFISIEPADEELLNRLNIICQNFVNISYLKLPELALNTHSTYTFEVYFRTRMGTENTQQFSFQSGGDEGLITYIEQQNFDIKIWEELVIVAQYLHFKCDNGFLQTILSPVSVTWTTELGNPIGIEKQEEQPEGVTYSQEILDKFIAQVNTENIIKVFISLENGRKTAFATQKIRFFESELTVKIKGGSRIHAYQNVLEMRTDVKDPDINPEIASQTDGMIIQWECKQMENLELDCVNFTQEQFLIDAEALQNTLQFDIAGRQMEPYKIYQFKLYGSKPPKKDQQDVQVIIAQELDLPALTVDFPASLLSRKVNLNEEVFTNIEYSLESEQNIDTLQYSATILYNFEARSTEVFGFKNTRLKIWEYFVDFQRSELLQIRYTVYNPLYMMPSSSMVNIFVNTPAYNCTISATGQDYIALESEIELSATYCVDSDQPLQYKFYLYQSQEEYDQERAYPIDQKRLILTDYLQQNVFTTILPQQKYPDKDQLIMINVMDAAGGMKNLTYPIKITENSEIDQNQYIQNIKKLITKSQNVDLSSSVRYLCIASQDIVLNQMINQNSQQIIDLKKELLNYLNIIKNSLLPSSELDAQIAKAIDELNQDYKEIFSTLNTIEISNMLTDQQQFLTNKQEQGSYLKLETRPIQSTLTAEKIETIVQSQLKLYDSVLNGINLNVTRQEVPYIQSQQDDSNQKLFEMTQQASDTSLLNLMPNQKSKIYQGKAFSLISQKITKKNIESYLGSTPKWVDSLNENTNINQNQDGELDDNDELFVGFKEFKTNPYASTEQFYYNQTKYPVRDPEIKIKGETNRIKIIQPISHDFDIQDTDANDDQIQQIKCIQKNQNNDWDTSQCQKQQFEDEDGNQKIKCLCKDLSMTTIVNDSNDIYKDSYIEEVFSEQGFNLLIDFKFWEDPVFYLLISLSILIMFSTIYGIYRDKQDQKLLEQDPNHSIFQDNSLVNSSQFENNKRKQSGVSINLEQKQQDTSSNSQESFSQKQSENQKQKDLKNTNQMQINFKKTQIKPDNKSSLDLDQNKDQQIQEQEQLQMQNLNTNKKQNSSLNSSLESIQKNNKKLKQSIVQTSQKNNQNISQEIQQQFIDKNNYINNNVKDIEQIVMDNQKQIIQIDKQQEDNIQNKLDKNNCQNQIIDIKQQEKNDSNLPQQQAIYQNQKSSSQEEDMDNIQIHKLNFQENDENDSEQITENNINNQIFNKSFYENRSQKNECQYNNFSFTPQHKAYKSQQRLQNFDLKKKNSKFKSQDILDNNNLVSDIENGKNMIENKMISSQSNTQNQQEKNDQNLDKQVLKSIKSNQYAIDTQKSTEFSSRQFIKISKKSFQSNNKIQQNQKQNFQLTNNNSLITFEDIKQSQHESQQQNQEKKEIKEKKKLPRKQKKKKILQGIYLRHQFFGIYFKYNPKSPRGTRFCLYYLKIILVFMSTGLFSQNINYQITAIIASVLAALFSGIPLQICKALVNNKKKPLKIIGIILTICSFAASFYGILVITVLMRQEKAQAWQLNFITSLAIDWFITQPIITSVKLGIFNKSLGTCCEPFIVKLYSSSNDIIEED